MSLPRAATKPQDSKENKGWIGVDLDGTLARYDVWRGPAHIGEPVDLMVNRVRGWRATGIEVRIVTARVHPGDSDSDRIRASNARHYIELWSETHIGEVLPVTCMKDFDMMELWDDRAVRVVANTGMCSSN